MGGAHSIPTDPSRTIQVIGAGYSRTGTVSMQLALTKLLDGPVIHGGTQILEGSEAYLVPWIKAYDAKRRGDKEQALKHVRDATRGFVGTTDMPTIDFIPELLELYPDARVVLVRRDPERWARSVAVIRRSVNLWWLPYVMWPIPGWRWFPRFLNEFTASAQSLMDGKKPVTTLLAAHNDRVRSLVPKEKLLEMEIGQGWEPLCEFLGLLVPDEPFPRVNDSEAVERYGRHVFKTIAVIWLGIFLLLGFAVYLTFESWQRGHSPFKFMVLGRVLS